MAASANGQLLLEVTSSKENAYPFLDRWGGKRLSLTFESHKDFRNCGCSTSLFVEGMLVMILLEPLCKSVCSFKIILFLPVFFPLWDFVSLILADGQPNWDSKERAYLLDSTTF